MNPDTTHVVNREAGSAASLAVTAGLAFLAKLESALCSIKNAANESAAGDPPAGYEQLAAESDALRIADECYHAGVSAMETAIRNWIYDERQHGFSVEPEMCEFSKCLTKEECAYAGGCLSAPNVERAEKVHRQGYTHWKMELMANMRALGCAVPTNEAFYQKLWEKNHSEN
jgi:hypothetical protein